MLVLSRFSGESIIVDDDIKIQILQVNGDTVKIGIEAPTNKSIYREELYVEIQEENKHAGSGESSGIREISEKLKKNKSKETSHEEAIVE